MSRRISFTHGALVNSPARRKQRAGLPAALCLLMIPGSLAIAMEDLSVSVYNLFDKKYFDPGRREDLEDQIQQDGRNFRIKITGRFF